MAKVQITTTKDNLARLLLNELDKGIKANSKQIITRAFDAIDEACIEFKKDVSAALRIEYDRLAEKAGKFL